MIKKISMLLIVALILVNCENKSEKVQPKVNLTPTAIVEVVQEAKVIEEVKVIEVKKEIQPIKEKLALPDGFIEKKVLKPIGINVPKTCEEWSDGCNTCDRKKAGQASCTTYTCENQAPFSCLKWQ
jgi:uncharacterized lipoprotein NlpE involved in copper resistance